jgi:hypothetical protein
LSEKSGTKGNFLEDVIFSDEANFNVTGEVNNRIADTGRPKTLIGSLIARNKEHTD